MGDGLADIFIYMQMAGKNIDHMTIATLSTRLEALLHSYEACADHWFSSLPYTKSSEALTILAEA